MYRDKRTYTGCLYAGTAGERTGEWCLSLKSRDRRQYRDRRTSTGAGRTTIYGTGKDGIVKDGRERALSGHTGGKYISGWSAKTGLSAIRASGWGGDGSVDSESDRTVRWRGNDCCRSAGKRKASESDCLDGLRRKRRTLWTGTAFVPGTSDGGGAASIWSSSGNNCCEGRKYTKEWTAFAGTGGWTEGYLDRSGQFRDESWDIFGASSGSGRLYQQRGRIKKRGQWQEKTTDSGLSGCGV